MFKSFNNYFMFYNFNTKQNYLDAIVRYDLCRIRNNKIETIIDQKSVC